MDKNELTNKTIYRVGFLALNPPSHLFHVAPIAFELSKKDNVSVTIYYSTDENLALLNKISGYYPGNSCEFIFLQTSLFHRLLRLFKKRPHPRVRNVITHNLSVLLNHHALVMTDKHMLEYKTPDGPQCICAYHGAGDRQTAFTSRYNDFDLLLVPGHAKWERMLRSGIDVENKGKIVGYPKFDPPVSTAVAEKIFTGDKPIVIYVPHFNPNETSWYGWGLDILEYFYRSTDFDLIFAPHIMLFAKGRPDLPEKYFEARNILIDVDGIRLSDMSYIKAADIYLGDVSSQVYEFIGYKTRPCVFLNTHNASWQGNENYRMWLNGAVVDRKEDLDSAVRTAIDQFSSFEPVQKKIVQQTFSTSSTSPAQRAAHAIMEFLATNPDSDLDGGSNLMQVR